MRGTAQPGGNTVTNGEIESHFIPLPDSKDPIAFEKINLQQIALTLLFFLQDIRLLGAGKPIQHASEIETDLNKAENMIRYLFNDVQLLKDGRHLQAEQMYRRLV